MKIVELGHTFLKVRDRERSERFYTEVLGLEVAARRDVPPMTFFTLGNHHDFGVVEVGDGPDEAPNSPGLFHVAFKVGDSLDELRAVKDELDAAGVEAFLMDHDVTKSIYVDDPDGNTIELYVDVSEAWRDDPDLITAGGPLEL